MWRELFSGNPATMLAIAALFFFIAVFGAALIWVMSRKRTEHYRAMAGLPIEGGADSGGAARKGGAQP